MRKAAISGVLLLVLALAVPVQGAPNDPLYSRQWGMEKIGAETAWAKGPEGRGAGITIAIVDSGVDLAHEDFGQGRFLAGKDYIDGGSSQDENGHGTHVAGIAAASTFNGRGVAGVAPDAKILPVRVLDEDGSGPGHSSQAVRWAADNGADVINLSLGSFGQFVFGPGFAESLTYAWNRGSIPVVAAGNDFLLHSGYTDEPALVVSATDRNDQKPDFSSGVGDTAPWGIAAPGGGNTLEGSSAHIWSTYWREGQSNSYASLRGTSMAAPHVAGAAAVLRSLGLSKQQTVDRLLETAKDLGAPGYDTQFGAGRLDLAAAVKGLSGSSGGGAGGSGGSGGSGSSGSGGGSSGGSGSGESTSGGGGTSGSGPTDQGDQSTGDPSNGGTDGGSSGDEAGQDGVDDQALGEDGDQSTNVALNLSILGAIVLGIAGYFIWNRKRARGSGEL